MLREPSDLFGDASGNRSLKLRKVFQRLMRELDRIDQARFSFLCTSSNGIRSEEARDAWSGACLDLVSKLQPLYQDPR